MSKKHYEAMAKEIRNSLAMCDSTHATTIMKLYAYNLANYLQSDNPKFNRERFLQACGVETEQN